MTDLELTDQQIDDYLSVALSNADRVGPVARHKLHGLLRYYAKKPHPFTACVRDNRKRFGPNAERVCAVLKDIIRGTTKWRGKNNPRDVGVSPAALSEEQKAEFVLDIPDDIQEFIDELDDEYMNSLMSEIDLAADTSWIGNGGVNDIKEQIEDVLNNEPDSVGDTGDDDTGMEYGRDYWVVDLDAELDDAFVCYQGNTYYDVPFSVDSDGHVKISDKSNWTEVKQAWVEANMSQEPQMLAEMFFDGSSEDVRLGEDGLIYKTLLREGEWKYSPGPGQVPINKPIKVVRDGISDGRSRVISMQELKSNFDNKIKDHVTIPLSHDNKVDENTGYIREVRIGKDESGRAILEAGFDFTEPEIKGKVERGTIANTSAGVLFDYIHKESGKKFNAILDHAALTNSPWLNGMKPFGVEASENLQVVAFSEENKPNKSGGEIVPETTTTETETVTTTEDTLFEKLGLSEDEVTARLKEYEDLKAKDKKHAVDAQIQEWQDKGVAPAVLTEAKAILMADSGEVAINLSEDGSSKPLTATQLVEKLIDSIPTVNLTEEPGTGEKGATEASKPEGEETDEYADLSLAEKTEISNMILFERVSEEEAVKQVRARREKK
jgi:hypothetical protein